MENYLELEDITLIPTETNVGHVDNSKLDFTVIDPFDQTGIPKSLPIFTSPMDSIINSDKNVIKNFVDRGIKPVIPLTESLESRLDLCKWFFCSFSIKEVESNFINQNQTFRNIPSQFHINVDAGNGHDQNLLSLCSKLKRIYGPQVIMMGGNIGCPEIYSAYSRAGFDYMRVGIASGSLVDQDKYGFHYPMASLLEGIKTFRKTSGIGLPRQVRVIADGGINSPSDIVKALALGADYVMCGRSFASVIESGGTIYKKSKTKSGDYQTDEIDPSTLRNYDGFKAKMDGLCRQYYGNTSLETRARLAGYTDIESWKHNTKSKIKVLDTAWNWVEIDKSLDEWIDEFKQCVYYAFMMTGTSNWEDFKKKIRYGSCKR